MSDSSSAPIEWLTASPAEMGLDAERIEDALAFAAERGSTGVVIARRGRIVAERYWDDGAPDRPRSLFSAGKPVVGALIGMAVDDGAIRSLDQPAADYLTEWRGDDRAAITIRHLLSMTSGLRCSFDIDFRKLPQAADEEAFALSLPLDHAPGSGWRYNNAAYRLLYSVLSRAVGAPAPEFARRRLFEPLGMKCAFWKVRVTDLAENPQTIWATAREAARVGQLMLDGGAAGGRRIIAPGYVSEATRSSQPHNPAYGLLWWLNGGLRYLLPSYRLDPDEHAAPLLPGCPPDLFAAMGIADQKVYVIPSCELVVVRVGRRAGTGRPLARGSFDEPFLAPILAAVRQDSASGSARGEGSRGGLQID